jgi:Tfp pilus assembly protein PilF
VAKETAKAELYAAGNALRGQQFDTAMTHAQQALCSAPSSYEPLETIGDIYTRQGDKLAAKRSYEMALRQLEAHGRDAMLVAQGHISPKNAADLIQRKIPN